MGRLKGRKYIAIFVAVVFMFSIVGNAFASIESFVAEDEATGDVYEYTRADLNEAQQDFIVTGESALWSHWITKKATAVRDSIKGLVKLDEVREAYQDSIVEGTEFDADAFTESDAAVPAVIEEAKIGKVTVDEDGAVVVTPGEDPVGPGDLVVESVSAINATTVEVTFDNDEVVEITEFVPTPLVANEETEITFSYNDQEFTETVTWVVEAAIELTATPNQFSTTNVPAGGIVIAVDETDEDGFATVPNLTGVVVEVEGETLINTLEYTIQAGTSITLLNTYLNSFEAGEYEVTITLANGLKNTVSFTVTTPEANSLELSIASEEVPHSNSGADNVITITEYDALGDAATPNLNGVIVAVNDEVLEMGATEDYTVVAGTSVDLNQAYLDGLDVGEYVVKITLLNGLTNTVSFKVTDESEIEAAITQSPWELGEAGTEINVAVTGVESDGATPMTIDMNANAPKVYVNGVLQNANRYSVAAGGADFDFVSAYLETLSVGEYSVVVEYEGYTTEAKTFEVAAGAADATNSSVDPEAPTPAASTEVVAGEVQAITFSFMDQFGNPLVEKAVTLAVASGLEGSFSLNPSMPAGVETKTEATINALGAETDASGQVTVYFKSTSTEIAGPATNDGEVTATIAPVTLTSNTIEVVPAVVNGTASDAANTDGTDGTTQIVLTANDVFENPITGLEETDIQISFGAEVAGVAANTKLDLDQWNARAAIAVALTDNADGTYDIDIDPDADVAATTFKIWVNGVEITLANNAFVVTGN